MPSLPPFGYPGRWFKGNLHTHSNRSDGKPAPQENIRWHVLHGYDFVSLTDHDQVTTQEGENGLSIQVIPGAEITARRGQVEYHVLGIGLNQMPVSLQEDIQTTIDAIAAAGGVSFIAHPYWHGHELIDLLEVKGYTGIEIFNAGCWLEINKGHALVHWDGLLQRERNVLGIASDDSHFHYPDHGYGWIMVRAETCDTPSIVNALRNGWFYSSMGPQIHDVRLEGDTVTVECSPAHSIYLIGDAWHAPNGVHAWDGQPLTEATFKLARGQRYLRVEVVDMAHRTAWTNAYFLSV